MQNLNHIPVTGYEVDSSNLNIVGYDPQNERLYVTFHSGDCYAYADVPIWIFEQIVMAKRNGRSTGSTFNSMVRNNPPGTWGKLAGYVFSSVTPAAKYKSTNAPPRPPAKRIVTVGDLLAQWVTGKEETHPDHNAWNW